VSEATLPRWRVLPALALGTLMATVDISAVNIALPSLSRAFRVPLTTVQWVVLAYVLTITATLLAFGRLADRIGRKRVYGRGLIVFTVASALCAAAPGALALFAARAVQGVGAAMMTANGSAILVSSFPASERGRALGAFGAAVGVGLALGPPVGGLLVGYLSWRWIFLVNLPLGLLAIAQLRARVPDDEPPVAKPPLDWAGVLSWSGMLALLMLGLSMGPHRGWGDSMVVLLLGAALALLVLFLVIESRVTAPLLPLDLMAGPIGQIGTLTLIGQALSIAVGIHLPLYLEEMWRFDAARSGRWLAVLPLTGLMMAPLAGRWADRFGSRAVSMLGMGLGAAGLGLLSRLGLEPRFAVLLSGMILVGVGLGLFTVPNASALLSVAPGGLLGLASGLQATMRNLGMAGGAAAMTAVIASRYAAHGGGRLESTRPDPLAFQLGSRDAYLGLAALAIVAIGLIAVRRGQPAAAPLPLGAHPERPARITPRTSDPRS
jgi:EmrB/QacA subfamily drug resistance transporter